MKAMVPAALKSYAHRASTAATSAQMRWRCDFFLTHLQPSPGRDTVPSLGLPRASRGGSPCGAWPPAGLCFTGEDRYQAPRPQRRLGRRVCAGWDRRRTL